MQIATGKVVAGKIVVDGLALDEGEVVTVLARDGEADVELTSDEQSELLEAIAEADRGLTIPAEELFAHLRR